MNWLAGCLMAFCLIGAVSAEGLQDVPGNRYEKSLLDTIKQIQSLDHQQALDRTRSLLEQYPHSRLGQMLYADLLLAKAGPLAHHSLCIDVLFE